MTESREGQKDLALCHHKEFGSIAGRRVGIGHKNSIVGNAHPTNLGLQRLAHQLHGNIADQFDLP